MAPSVETEIYLRVFPVFAITAADRDLVLGPPEAATLVPGPIHLPPRVVPLHPLARVPPGTSPAQRGPLLGLGDPQLEVWEQALATSAARVVQARLRAVPRLGRAFQHLYAALRGDGFPEVAMTYRGDSWWSESDDEQGLASAYCQWLATHRARDREVGYTVDGPHRHDLSLRADGRPVRDVLSSGQVRVVASSLRLAALAEVEAERGDTVPTIIDDVDAEVDGMVMERLVDHLGTGRQILLSSAHEETAARSCQALRCG